MTDHTLPENALPKDALPGAALADAPVADSLRAELDRRPMSRAQILAIAVAVALNGLDGFDVLSISFAAPGIATEWGIDRAALGVVLSMELLGMAIGALVLGGAADRFGRRPTILGCLVAMAIGMGFASTATGIAELCVWRVLTGLGIGGMLAAINAVAAEFSNARHRTLALSLVVIGYPIGAVLGGSVASGLLQAGDWRVVFQFGFILTVLFIPLVWFTLPESIDYLADRQPPNALARINRTIAGFGMAARAALPQRAPGAAKRSILDVVRPPFLSVTLLVTLAYFGQIATFYFILKWAPKLVADLGHSASTGAQVLVWANVGGVIGGAAFGLLASRYGLKPMSVIALAGSIAMVPVFGLAGGDLMWLTVAAALAGMFTNSGVVGIYAIVAYAFPTHLRATGTGFAVGIGRGGSVLSPIVAGALLQAGFSLPLVAVAMAGGSLIALVALLRLSIPDERVAARAGQRPASAAP